MRPTVRSLFAVAAALALLCVGSASGRPTIGAPHAVFPRSGVTDVGIPPFGWTAVAGADHYEFAVSADPSFSSPVAQGYFTGPTTTRNTRGTLTAMIPNGTYWWHVRAVSKNGAVSGWSASRSFRRSWAIKPGLLAPANGAMIDFPRTPLVLRWSAVPYAAKYNVYLATDSDLGTLVGGRPIETEGLSFSPSVTLAIGTYYWAVVPLDAHGNRGARSRVASFQWRWRSDTRPTVTDLVSAPEHFDPQFRWTAVAGAASYEVEVNPSHDWAVGSKVCCRDPVVTTTLSPTQLLANNRYYWRIRAINVDGAAGRWNEGPSFTKIFDNVGGGLVAPSIKNLHLRDNNGDGGPKPAGWVTSSPVVVWDAAPGASGYQVDVAPFGTADRPGDCDWVARNRQDHWQVDTAIAAWTPLAPSHVFNEPYPARNVHATDDGGKVPKAGQAYCVRVRARTDRDIENRDVFGDYTYLPNAFRFGGYAGGSGSPNAAPGTYLGPVQGALARQTPLFTWRAIPGAASYWVLVAKDPSFTTVIDYALTNVPAYAPRHNTSPTTYSDEQTLYYWAVLPANRSDGAGAPGDPLSQYPANFKKLSLPPTLLAPNGKLVVGPPTFRWTPVLGARYYRIQVSQDRNFGTTLDDVTTDSTAYSATKTYPSAAALYVRVRAEDENKIGLSWSSARQFRDTLARPVPSASNPRKGDLIPTWTWQPVQGARSYDIHVELPDGTQKDFPNDLLAAFTATSIGGTGVFHWQVRAQFGLGLQNPGPYSRPLAFTRTISAPKRARARAGGKGVLLSWRPKAGAKTYRLQIASTPDFGSMADNATIETTNFAPSLASYAYKGGRFYWRVAAVDAAGNTGNFTKTQSFHYSG